MKLTHLSLCSGIGGIDLAFEWAGFETVAQCEIDEYASKVIAKNFRGVHNFEDIRTITDARLRERGIKPGEITVLSAGIPCQPYSLAGKGKGDADSRDLWEEFKRVSKLIKPRWCVIENTYGLYSRDNQRYFRRILNGFAEMGYTTSWGIWGACAVGAPHRRDRIFIVGRNTDCENDKEEQKIFRKDLNSGRICRDVSGAVGERRGTSTIQRGEFAESGRAQDERRIQKSRVQPKRVRGGISYAASDELWLHGSKEQIKKVANERSNNRTRSQGNAGGKWWQVEPDVGRVADGISSRVDRLRCLGNAVVPQQIYPIAQAIAEIETSTDGAAAGENKTKAQKKGKN